MRRLTALLAFSAALLLPLSVSAQDDPGNPPLDEFSAMRFSPAIGPQNYMGVEGARVSGHLVPYGGLTLEYAHRPFTLYDATCAPDDDTDCEVDDVREHLVRYYAAGHLTGALSLFDRVQVGLAIPVAIARGDSFSYTAPGGTDFVAVEGGRNFVLGDPRLDVKGRIFGEGTDGLNFAASAFVTFPVGQLAGDEDKTGDTRFMGEGTVTAGGQFIGEFEQRGFHVAGNVGAIYRPTQTLFSTQVGSQLTYGVAFGYDVTPLIMVFAELEGASSFSAQVDENPLEGRVAGTYRVGDLAFTLGAGAGLIAGVGTPVFRAVGQAEYAPVRGDSDGDGIDDADDACPSEPEDMDGYMDQDGCPDEDNDGDGMLDADDACPDEAEDMDGFQDDDGCPDRDNDGDGVDDGYDSCPDDPEDMDGDRDDDGCPDNDTDQDGIPDHEDECPNEPEDTDGFGDEDGCPEDDFDGDGILDVEDECPDQPENFNGVEDEDGCPEPDSEGDGVVDVADECPDQAEDINGYQDGDGCPDGPAAVAVSDSRVTLNEDLTWARRNRLPPGSRRQIAAVAFALRSFPQFARSVRIEVSGQDQELAGQRGQAIKDELVAQGVPAERLRAVTREGGEGVVFVVDDAAPAAAE